MTVLSTELEQLKHKLNAEFKKGNHAVSYLIQGHQNHNVSFIYIFTKKSMAAKLYK